MVLKNKVQGHIEELSHHIKASFGIAGTRASILICCWDATLNLVADFHSWAFRYRLWQEKEQSQRILEALV